MMRDKTSFTPTAKAPPSCIAASANWVAVSNSFFYQVIVVESDCSESLMNGRVGQSCPRTCGPDSPCVPPRSRGEIANVGSDMVAVGLIWRDLGLLTEA